MSKSKGKIFKLMLFGCFAINISGCAISKLPPTDPQDPYEHFNRKVFAFNMALDRAFFRPVAKVYDVVLPWPVKKGVCNIFSNIGDVTSAANEVLQLHFAQVVADLARIVINTTVGVGGLFDVATKLGLEKDKEDFGLTLAVWGSKNTPYIVLPFLGPSTIRDAAVGLPVDYLLLSIWPYVKWDAIRYGMLATNTVSNRASLLPGDEVINQAFDPYIFVRDAYSQRRAYLAKESIEEHITKYVDEDGVVRRRHHSIPISSILAN
ncbi:MAG: VacJ family lipoprotein [Coxiellaceae bacterium]|jgi:phospholipid-binding lipoprotein MlaA|nr:VacJ family lipoprotein [Coxiellaceae bacterium]